MFTKETTRQIQNEIQAALEAIGKKHGFNVLSDEIDFRRTRSGDRGRLMAMDFYPAGKEPAPAFNASTVDLTEAKAGTPQFKLNAAMKRFGIERTANNKGDTLTSYNPNCPKYCFSYRSVRGTDWKCTPEQAKKRFG